MPSFPSIVIKSNTALTTADLMVLVSSFHIRMPSYVRIAKLMQATHRWVSRPNQIMPHRSVGDYHMPNVIRYWITSIRRSEEDSLPSGINARCLHPSLVKDAVGSTDPYSWQATGIASVHLAASNWPHGSSIDIPY